MRKDNDDKWTVNKYVREDGKVGVVLSAGRNSGLYTEGGIPKALVFDPYIVEHLLYSVENSITDLRYYIESEYGDNVCKQLFEHTDYGQLYVEFVQQSREFDIIKYDGGEQIKYPDFIA